MTTPLRPFHEASWNEPLILELSSEGERGIIPPEVEPELAVEVGDGISAIPAGLRRSLPPGLPELSQPQVLRHYLRLSQETDRKSTRLNSSHIQKSRMPSSA